MSKSKFLVSVLVLSLSAPVFAGSSSSGGIANPAATNCIDVGGELVGYHSPEGESGYCKFERALIDEWTLYRATVSLERTLATEAFLGRLNGTMGKKRNPVAFCQQMGGAIETVSDIQGGKLKICVFTDNSVIAADTLYHGPSQGYEHLTRVLMDDEPAPPQPVGHVLDCVQVEPMADAGIAVSIDAIPGESLLQATVEAMTMHKPVPIGTFMVKESIGQVPGAPNVYSGQGFELVITNGAPGLRRAYLSMSGKRGREAISEEMLCKYAD